MRTFIALPINQTVKANIEALLQAFKAQVNVKSIRWVPSENLHLTLNFLGEIPAEKIEIIKTTLIEIASAHKPFTSNFSHCGVFPDLKHPRILWIGFDQTGILKQIQKNLEEQLAPLGFPPEKRAFSPHLTLARISGYASPAEVANIGDFMATINGFEPIPCQFSEIVFFKSVLLPAGAQYTRLQTAPFPKQG